MHVVEHLLCISPSWNHADDLITGCH